MEYFFLLSIVLWFTSEDDETKGWIFLIGYGFLFLFLIVQHVFIPILNLIF